MGRAGQILTFHRGLSEDETLEKRIAGAVII
jgi:hypothetical protein